MRDYMSDRMALLLAREAETSAPHYDGKETVLEAIDVCLRVLETSPQARFVASVELAKSQHLN